MLYLENAELEISTGMVAIKYINNYSRDKTIHVRQIILWLYYIAYHNSVVIFVLSFTSS